MDHLVYLSVPQWQSLWDVLLFLHKPDLNDTGTGLDKGLFDFNNNNKAFIHKVLTHIA